MSIKEYYANLTFDFIKKYSPYLIALAAKQSKNPKQLIKSYLLKHFDYGTIVLHFDDGELVGVANFDIQDANAHILNCVIKPSHRNKYIMQQMTLKAMTLWRNLETLTFEREARGSKKLHTIRINRFLQQGIKK